MLNFDTKKLMEVLKAFYNSTGARVAIYNTEFIEIASYPAKYCKLCSTLRTIDKINYMCMESDKNAFDICRKSGKMYTYKCGMGLFEAVSPIIIHNNLEGYIMMGQVLSSREEVFWHTTNFTHNTVLNNTQVNEIISKMPTVSFEHVESICFLMNMCVEYLCTSTIIQKASPRASKIDDYLKNHLSEKLSAEDIANAFYISRATLHNILKDAYNMSLTERINYLRIEKAKTYLSNGLSVDEIYTKLGYNDKTYLYKNFKRHTGLTIREYLFTNHISKLKSPTITNI